MPACHLSPDFNDAVISKQNRLTFQRWVRHVFYGPERFSISVCTVSLFCGWVLQLCVARRFSSHAMHL